MKQLAVWMILLAGAAALFGVWAWALGIGWSEPIWTAYSYTVVGAATLGVMLLIVEADR